MHVELSRLPIEAMRTALTQIEPSAAVAGRVAIARELQLARQGVTNSRLSNRQIEQYCRTTRPALKLLDEATVMLGLSARAHHRVLRVARTIADLAGVTQIDLPHIGEAIALRRLDRAPAPVSAGSLTCRPPPYSPRRS